jgi:hypothetical protein
LNASGVHTDVPYGLVFVGILIIACALFFFRAGEFDGGPGVLWAVISVLISLLVWRVFRLGFIGILVGQLVLFVGITLVRTARKS